MLLKRLLLLLVVFTSSASVMAQGSELYSSGLKVNLSEDGSQYFRLITWHQGWLTASQNSNNNLVLTPSLRRSRMLMYAQLNDRFLILTHYGLNGLNADNMHPTGKSSGPAVFMHDAWVEYMIVKKYLYLGGGLHYWNGISRLTNQSTLNIMTLDAPRFNWPTVGTSDQFARHMGAYAKGKLGKLDYRLAFNNPIKNSFDAINGIALDTNVSTYQTRSIYGNRKANYAYQGYFMYQFLEQESNFLPFTAGTYLGTKRVFNLGVGFFNHVDGTVGLDLTGDTITYNVNLLAVDLFYDTPIGAKNAAFNIYAAYYNFDFGPNYRLVNTSDVIGTGEIYYVQTGYVLPDFSHLGRLQPYLSASYRKMEAYQDPATTWSAGLNWFLEGHHAKLTLAFNQNNRGTLNTRVINLQAMVYL